MRILILTKRYPTSVGCKENNVLNLCIDLLRRGHEVSVAALFCSGLRLKEVTKGVKIYKLRSAVQRDTSLSQKSRSATDSELLCEIRQIIFRENPGFIHARYWNTDY